MSKIAIKKAKGGFVVNVIAANGEKLSTSEVLKTKQSAIKNVKAQARAFGARKVTSVICGKILPVRINQKTLCKNVITLN